MRFLILLSLALSMAVAMSACISSPAPPPTIRYFSVDTDEPAAKPATEVSSVGLRLRSISAASYLKDRIVWRANVEYGFYEFRRWSEPPADFAMRALEHELFEVRRLRSLDSGGTNVLQVELTAFEEVLEPAHEARVALVVHFAEPNGEALVFETFEERQAVMSDDPIELAQAMSRALRAVVARVSDSVQAAVAGTLPPR